MKFFNIEMSDVTADKIAIKDNGELSPETMLCDVIVTPVYKLVQRGNKFVAVHSSGEILQERL